MVSRSRDKGLPSSVLKDFRRGEIISIALPSDVLARSKDLVISAFNRSLGILTVIVLDLGFTDLGLADGGGLS